MRRAPFLQTRMSESASHLSSGTNTFILVSSVTLARMLAVGLIPSDLAVWNRHDYRERTFNRVLEGRTEFYQPREKVSANGNGSRPEKTTSKPSPPTHDELRDRWIEGNPHHVHGLGEWRRYEAGIWPVVSESSVKAEISEVIEEAKPEGIKPTASILASVTELTRIKVFVPEERWDADSDILVCKNGALHISTGELVEHRPGH